jgi:hypothetical protein
VGVRHELTDELAVERGWSLGRRHD